MTFRSYVQGNEMVRVVLNCDTCSPASRALRIKENAASKLCGADLVSELLQHFFACHVCPALPKATSQEVSYVGARIAS